MTVLQTCALANAKFNHVLLQMEDAGMVHALVILNNCGAFVALSPSTMSIAILNSKP